jgi:hypothetical protein
MIVVRDLERSVMDEFAGLILTFAIDTKYVKISV